MRILSTYTRAILAFFATIILLSSCGLDFSRSQSAIFKKCVRKNGGLWEITQIDEYRLYGVNQPLLFTEERGKIGTYEFTKDEPWIGIAGDLGYYDLTGEPTKEFIYQVSSDDDTDEITVGVFYYDEMRGEAGSKGFAVYDGYTKESMTWANDYSRNDTIITEVYYFDNLGN